MSSSSPKRFALVAFAAVFALTNARASDTVTIKIPIGSKMSLVHGSIARA